MRTIQVKDIYRKTSIPMSVIRKAVEEVYGVKLSNSKKKTTSPAKKSSKKAA